MTVLLEEKPVSTREFSVADDRCDRCKAEAQQAFTKDGSELLFCNHHGNRYAIILGATGWEVVASGKLLCTCQMCVPVSRDEQGREVEVTKDDGPEGPVPA